VQSLTIANLRASAFTVAFYGWTALLAIAMLPAAPFVSPARMRRYAGFWQRGIHRLLLATTGIRHEVRGLENLPAVPVLIAAKHQSAWETLFFHTVRPDIVIGLKQELRKLPVFGWYLQIGENIFVDRGGAARALRSLVTGAKAAVARGCSILIFPEGTRRPPLAPPDYKSGVAALYSELNIPVIPVALNSGLFWGPGLFAKREGVIIVEFLEPILPGLDRRAFMRELESRIEDRSGELARLGQGTLQGRISALPDRRGAS
jgi:1-acyl-sn-glycerol-3-phosphate acyltransferase